MEDNKKQIKRAFSRTAFAVCICELAANLTAIFLSYYLDSFIYLSDFWYYTVQEMVPLYLIGMPLGYLIVSGMPVLKTEKQGMSLSMMLTYLCIALLAMYLGSIISSYVQGFIEGLLGVVPPDIVTESIETGNLWINLFALVIIAPVTEELFYRKMIIDRTAMFGEKQAVIFSSLAFALMHGNIYQIFYAFIVGWLFGIIYLRSGNIMDTIALHMAVNFICGAVPTLIERFAVNELVMNAYYSVYSMITFAMYVLGFIFIIFEAKRMKFKKRELEMPKRRWGKLVFGNFGAICMFITAAILLGLMTFA